MFTCSHVCMFTCSRVRMFTCSLVHMFTCLYVYMFACLYASHVHMFVKMLLTSRQRVRHSPLLVPPSRRDEGLDRHVVPRQRQDALRKVSERPVGG